MSGLMVVTPNMNIKVFVREDSILWFVYVNTSHFVYSPIFGGYGRSIIVIQCEDGTLTKDTFH